MTIDQVLKLALCMFALVQSSMALSAPRPSHHCSGQPQSRRSTLQNILRNSLVIATTTTSITSGDSAYAVTDEGISVITDSSVGTLFRKSAIQGARTIDKLDAKWATFSDSLREENKCDENTGRKLFDNGFRKDGTRVGNPVLGALCNPATLGPLDETLATKILDLAVLSALQAGAAGGDLKTLQKSISDIEDLVKPSFERSMNNSKSEEEKKRKYYDFQVYTRMRAINNALNGSSSSVKKFQLIWGQALVSTLAPNAGSRDYVSPFPNMKDEFEDYDYDKNALLDGLGALKVSLDKMKDGGMLSYFEISIPYDDYGSVVTVAIDDDVTIGAEIFLSEQNMNIGGAYQALVRAVLDKARINYGIDAFYLDPSTTKQELYNPTQLLLSLSNLRKM